MEKATIRTGLKVFTTILDKPYQTGQKVAKDFKSNVKTIFDEFLPQWNYTAKPELQIIQSLIRRMQHDKLSISIRLCLGSRHCRLPNRRSRHRSRPQTQRLGYL
ncbi:MAG: ISAzo13-like element transposase-related protein [Leptolyngbya sp. IPPAS B-1204]